MRLSVLLSTFFYASTNVLFQRVYVSVCDRGYNSLSVCSSIRSSIRLSDQIDGRTNNSSVRPSIHYPFISINCHKTSQAFYACPISLEVVGLRAFGIGGCSKWQESKVKPEVMVELEPHLCFDSRTTNLMGFNPINFVSFLNFLEPLLLAGCRGI